MAPRSIIFLEIPAADTKIEVEFFTHLLGWRSTFVDPSSSYAIFQAGNFEGGFAHLDENFKPGDIVPYVESEDIEADLRQVESLGGRTLAPKTEIPGYGWYGWFADPAGNRIGLYTRVPGPAA
jgi:hypothetical protein